MKNARALGIWILAVNGALIGAGAAIAFTTEHGLPRPPHAAAGGVVVHMSGTIASTNMGMAMDMAGAPGVGDHVAIASMTLAGFVSAYPMAHHTGAKPESVATLRGPRSAAHTRTFSLTARPARLVLGPGKTIDAWTYNGTSPGPVLRVHQGDLVVVHLVNRLPVATSIHWHGIDVPGGEDGVAGLTQDAVPPGRPYTYRFIADKPGTYWYHAHQDSLTQVDRGLFGAVVVTPRTPALVAAVDRTLVLHTWKIDGADLVTVNGVAGMTPIAAPVGAMVRLRFVNTDSTIHILSLSGAPFAVTALDGHDLHGPSPLRAVALPLGAGQRYDVAFRVPLGHAVGLRLYDVADDQHSLVGGQLALRVGTGAVPHAPAPRAWFDLTRYGTPDPSAMLPYAHSAATYTLRLGSNGGVSFTQPGLTFTINDQMSPNVPPIMVTRGEVVRLHIENHTTAVHPMHLHGHSFMVLKRNGRALSGSPVRLDTLDVFPDENYDVAFIADNPGVWMLHCHNLYHARHGMSMMVMYRGVTTPFVEGGKAGNISD